MMYFSTISAAVLAVRPLITHADDGFLSIPASELSGNGTVYNNTGTAAFVPVLRPEPATVTFFSCRGKAKFKKEVIFTLRRNQPQQANVDMTTVRTGLGETGFVTKNINRIAQGKVDNRRFNYFIVADSSKVSGNQPGNRAICKARNVWWAFAPSATQRRSRRSRSSIKKRPRRFLTRALLAFERVSA